MLLHLWSWIPFNGIYQSLPDRDRERARSTPLAWDDESPLGWKICSPGLFTFERPSRSHRICHPESLAQELGLECLRGDSFKSSTGFLAGSFIFTSFDPPLMCCGGSTLYWPYSLSTLRHGNLWWEFLGNTVGLQVLFRRWDSSWELIHLGGHFLSHSISEDVADTYIDSSHLF